LAGLDVSRAGVEYLIKDLRLKDRPVIFNVVKKTANDSDTADADITLKKVGFLVRLSKYILELIGCCKSQH
jgi:hypothetical protein